MIKTIHATRAAASLLAMTAGFLLSGTPAQAADVAQCVYKNGLCAGSGLSYNYSTRIQACDLRADGLGVRTWYITGKGLIDYVGDGNGSKDGCGQEKPSDGGSIDVFQVCYGPLNNETCSPWKRGY